MLSNQALLSLVDDIDKTIRLTKEKYRSLLIRSGLISQGLVSEDNDMCEFSPRKLSRHDFILKTLEYCNSDKSIESIDKFIIFLNTLQEDYGDKILSSKTLTNLARDGIEFDSSIAGEIADPVEERSRLERKLNKQGMEQVKSLLDQSLDNYSMGNYEASNSMTRTAIETLVEEIAIKISNSRHEDIPAERPPEHKPCDYRKYLAQVGFLDDHEKRFLNAFYSYASIDGSHSGVSSESEARLRRYVVVAISLFFLEKLEDDIFMSDLISKNL